MRNQLNMAFASLRTVILKGVGPDINAHRARSLIPAPSRLIPLELMAFGAFSMRDRTDHILLRHENYLHAIFAE